MPPKPKDFDREDFVRRYVAGETLQQLAREFHIGVPRLRETLALAGVAQRSKAEAVRGGRVKVRYNVTDPAILDAYLGGEGLEPLAERYGVSPGALGRALARQGVALRDRSEAMVVRLEAAGPDGRRALTEAARSVSNAEGSTFLFPTAELRRKRLQSSATRRQRTEAVVGIGELEMRGFLAELGGEFIPQKQVDTYNIDIALGSVAVEIHRPTNHPMLHAGGRLKRRAEYLIDRGWAVLYVWAYPPQSFTRAAAEYAIAFAKAAEADASLRSECRVIRGSGELASLYCLHPHHRTLVDATVGDLNWPG